MQESSLTPVRHTPFTFTGHLMGRIINTYYAQSTYTVSWTIQGNRLAGKLAEVAITQYTTESSKHGASVKGLNFSDSLRQAAVTHCKVSIAEARFCFVNFAVIPKLKNDKQ